MGSVGSHMAEGVNVGCSWCGKEGYFGINFRHSRQVCFHCDREGRIRAHCPFLVFDEVQDPTPLA